MNMDSKKKLIRSTAITEDNLLDSLYHKIVEYHKKRHTKQDVRVEQLRCTFRASQSLSSERNVIELEIPHSAEEILENLGLARREPEIPQRFLQDFAERNKNEDIFKLDSRVARAVEDAKIKCKIEYKDKMPSNINHKLLTRAATLLSLHSDYDSPKEESVSPNKELKYESLTPISKAVEELNNNDSDSSLYTTPQKNLKNDSISSDSIESYPFNTRRRSLSCSAVDCIKSRFASEYTNLYEQFKTFRGVSHSNIEISMHSPVKRKCSSWCPSDSDDDDILRVVLPARERGESIKNTSVKNYELYKSQEAQFSYENNSELNWIRVVDCDRCDLCRIQNFDFRSQQIHDKNVSSENQGNINHSYDGKQCNHYKMLKTETSIDSISNQNQQMEDLQIQTLLTPMDNIKKTSNKDDEIIFAKEDTYPRKCNEPESFNKADSQELKELQRVIEQVKPGRESESIIKQSDEFKSKINEIEHLKIQLEAAKEALFVYQNKKENDIENLEEELNICKQMLCISENRRLEEEEKKRSLETALIEMQKEKQRLQMNLSDSIHNLNYTKMQEELKSIREVAKNTDNKLKNKEEENIKLRMTILQIQEELSKDNNHKEIIIEEKDKYIEKLENKIKALSELQLHTGKEKLERTFSMSALEESGYSKEVERDSSNRLEQLMYQLEQQQKELEKLRIENSFLKSNAIQEKQDINGQEEEEQSDSPLLTDISSDVATSTSEAKVNINLLKKLKEAEDKAYQAESRADNLNLLLNHKLIEINKLQLTLSSQTKELIQLEKAYYQLRCHLFKTRKSSCPALRRSSSKINNTV